jgi:citrate lyase subunit beta/citryl-CoA lyase
VSKAVASGADGLILDLEDPVPSRLKEHAHAGVKRAIAELRASNQHVAMYVRINPLDSDLSGGDMDAIVVPGLDGLVSPKVSGRDDGLQHEPGIRHDR